MVSARTYGDPCGIARALDVVGERWALLVVRELLLGPKRFTDLRSGMPGVSADVLSDRLRQLEADGVLARTALPPPAASRVYGLTERGRGLEPLVLELGRWGSRLPFPAGERSLSADSAVLALKTLFDPRGTAGTEDTYELRLGGEPFTVRVADGGLEARRGPAGTADATIATDTGTLAAVLWHGRAPAEAEQSGALEVTGSRAAVRRFLRRFPAPAQSMA
jgi:DNA-binding HxlR family transcriptional regulator